MKKKIRIAADYFCYPLWWDGGSDVGDINPESLPISTALQKSLMTWSDDFDALFNKEDPAESGFETNEEEEAFQIRGLHLWLFLQKELKDEYHVSFNRWGHQNFLQSYHFSAPQYMALMKRIFEDQLPFDQTALNDLVLSASDIQTGENSLIENGIFLSSSDKSINGIHRDVRMIMATLLSPDYQIMADYKFSDQTSSQITIGFEAKDIAAEVTNGLVGERTLMDLGLNQDAVELLIVNSRAISESDIGSLSPLSDLLELAEAIVNISRLERKQDDAFESVKSALWIKTKEALWWVDETHNQAIGKSVYREQLHQKLGLFLSQR